MPGCSGEPVVTTSCAFYFLHARLRVHRAPGIPCALCFGPNESSTTRAFSRGEIAEVCVITRDVILHIATASPVFIPPPFVGRVAGRRPVGWGLSVQRVVTSPPPRPQLRCGRPSPLKGEGQERATSPGKRKIACRQSRRGPFFETPASGGLLRMRS